MANTFHGHHIPGSTKVKLQRETAEFCGGVSSCPRCKTEAREYVEMNRDTFVPANAPDDFQEKAKRILIDYVDSNYSTSFEKPVFEVYIVWFAKVLQNWKALVSTDRPDGRYYELTYNGDKRETYVNEYANVKNTVVPD